MTNNTTATAVDRSRSKSNASLKPKLLEYAWRIFHERYNSSLSTADWTSGQDKALNDNLRELCEFDTIQGFWSCYNSLPQLDQLRTKDSFHLMKKLNAVRTDGTVDTSRYTQQDNNSDADGGGDETLSTVQRDQQPLSVQNESLSKTATVHLDDPVFDDDDDDDDDEDEKEKQKMNDMKNKQKEEEQQRNKSKTSSSSSSTLSNDDHQEQKNKDKKSSDSILPRWEDPANINGGHWKFRVDGLAQGQDVWRELAMAVIGEREYSEVLKAEGNEICGISVTAGPNVYTFTIWHSRYDEEDKDNILDRTRSILMNDRIQVNIRGPYYKLHSKN